MEAELQKLKPTRTRMKRVCVSSTFNYGDGQEEEIKDLCNEVEADLRYRADQIITDALGEDSDNDPDYKPKGVKEDEENFIVEKRNKKRKPAKEKKSTARKLKVSSNATFAISTERIKNRNTDLSSTQSQSPVEIKNLAAPQATSTPVKRNGKMLNTVMPHRQLQSLPCHLHPGHLQPIRLVSRYGRGDGLRGPCPPGTSPGNPSKVRTLRPTQKQGRPVLARYPGIMSQHRLGAPPVPGLHTGGNNPNTTSHHQGRTNKKSNPPLIQLDTSPPRADDVAARLTSLGCSIVSSMPGMVRPLPPNISTTRTPSSNKRVTPLTCLARALEKMGETEGSRRLVKFELTESQIQGLQALGILN